MSEVKLTIIGSLHHNTLGVIRSIGEAKVPKTNISVVLVTKNEEPVNILSTTKYIDQENIYYVDDYEGIVPFLVNKQENGESSVIICCSDGAAGEVISAKEILKQKYKIPNATIDIRELMVKSNQDEIARKCGLIVPESADFDSDSTIDWDSFPCIIKPYRSAMAAGKSDIHVVNSKVELNEILRTIRSERIQIQKYIDKDIEFQLIGCSLDAGETIIIPGFTNIIRQPKTTNTGYLLYSPIDQLQFDLEPVKKFIRTTGYSGLFSVEFIRGKDGKDYFLEINMRNDGNAYCVESAGVNLPYIWAYYQTYGKLPDVPTSFNDPIYFIPDFSDLKLAMKTIGPFKWLKQFLQAQSHSIYNKNDMGPFRYELWRQVKRIIKMR